MGLNKLFGVSHSDLRTFLSILDCGTITAGAKQIHLSLAAASERLQSLEEAVGVRLFDRTKRGVCPTPAGLMLAQHARSMLLNLEQLRLDLIPFAKGMRGRIRLLCNTSALTEFLPEAIGAFLSEHPDIDIDIEEMWSRQIAQAIRDRRADVGILSDSGDMTGLETRLLRSDRLVMICAKGHPLARQRRVSFLETLNSPFVGLVEDSALHKYLNDRATRLGRTIHYRVRLKSLESVCRLVSEGVGVSVVPGRTALRLGAMSGVSTRELRDAWASRRMIICSQPVTTSPAYVLQFIDALAPVARSSTSA